MPSPTANPPHFCSKVFLTYSYGQVKAKAYTPDSFSITFKMVISGTERERTLNLSTFAVYNSSHLHFLSTYIFMHTQNTLGCWDVQSCWQLHALPPSGLGARQGLNRLWWVWTNFIFCKNKALMLCSTFTRCGRAGKIASFQERRRCWYY